jgi:hypothetical protein
MNINLHIEQITLDGIDVSQAQQPQLQAAIQSELAHLLLTRGLTSGALSHAQLVAAPIQLSGVGQPAEMGKQIARTVYGSLGR